MARPRTWLAALVAGTALLVVVPATAAAAHNVLRSTTPADGSTVDSVPAQVVLTFDQPALALGTELVVTAPDGRDVADGAPVLVDSTVGQAVGGDLPAGTYTVRWRVTSADGHPISGSFTFTATQATNRPLHDPTTTASPAPASPAGTVAGRGPGRLMVAAVAALLVLGAAAWSWRRRGRAGRDPS